MCVSVWDEKVWSRYRVCVSFTLCWLSLQGQAGGLPGFKGFIGKVVYPPFLLWGALV